MAKRVSDITAKRMDQAAEKLRTLPPRRPIKDVDPRRPPPVPLQVVHVTSTSSQNGYYPAVIAEWDNAFGTWTDTTAEVLFKSVTSAPPATIYYQARIAGNAVSGGIPHPVFAPTYDLLQLEFPISGGVGNFLPTLYLKSDTQGVISWQGTVNAAEAQLVVAPATYNQYGVVATLQGQQGQAQEFSGAKVFNNDVYFEGGSGTHGGGQGGNQYGALRVTVDEVDYPLPAGVISFVSGLSQIGWVGVNFVTGGGDVTQSQGLALVSDGSGAPIAYGILDYQSGQVTWGAFGTDAIGNVFIGGINTSIERVLKVGGDLGGQLPNPKVVGIQGVPVNPNPPTAFQVMQFNNGQWGGSSVLDGGTW